MTLRAFPSASGCNKSLLGGELLFTSSVCQASSSKSTATQKNLHGLEPWTLSLSWTHTYNYLHRRNPLEDNSPRKRQTLVWMGSAEGIESKCMLFSLVVCEYCRNVWGVLEWKCAMLFCSISWVRRARGPLGLVTEHYLSCRLPSSWIS